MAINKINYGNQTLIDLTDTTAEASNVETGVYFYTNAGVRTQGSMVIKTIYVGSTAPDASLGSDGDIYLQIGE